jgi:hypothetical protein
MTTGFVAAAGDLDLLFKARTSAKIANVGFLSNGGVDLSNRFEPRGTTIAIANTNFKAGANDLAVLFRGIAASLVDISTMSCTNTDAGTTTCAYRLMSTGNIEANNGTTSQPIRGTWISPATNVGLYSARVTPQSGTSPSGEPLNTWVNLANNREWNISNSSFRVSGFLVEIRLDSSGVVLDSATVSLQVH